MLHVGEVGREGIRDHSASWSLSWGGRAHTYTVGEEFFNCQFNFHLTKVTSFRHTEGPTEES